MQNHLLCLSIAALLILIQEGTCQVRSQQNSPAPAGIDPDLCKHSFHSFLCNPAKNKRRLYNGQKPGSPPPPPSNLLDGENSFQQSTRLRPDLPKQEPKPQTSNIEAAFQAPGYLPPRSESNLDGGSSFLESNRLLPPTTKPPPRPTTQRFTTQRPTTQRVTTTTTTTPRPTTRRATTTTTPRPTTRRATTTTTPRPTTRAPIRTTTEPNLIPDGAQNSGTRIRPEVPEAKENLCGHAFHSFLCDSPKSSKPRRIYNGQRRDSTNLIGENSFQQSNRILPSTTPKPRPTTSAYIPTTRPTLPTTTTSRPYQPNIISDNSYLSPSRLLPTTTRAPIRTTTRAPVRTTPIRTTPKPIPSPTTSKPEPEVQPDGAQNPSIRVRPDESKIAGKEDLCKHAFHSFLCDSPKPTKQRRIYNGQKVSPDNSNVLGANSFQQPSRLLPPTTPRPVPTTTAYRPTTRPTTAYQPIVRQPTTIRTTAKPYQYPNIIADNSYLSPSRLLPTTTRAPPRTTPIPTTPKPITRPPVRPVQEPEVQPDSAQNPSIRVRPDSAATSDKDDLCKHSFHSFLCSGSKPSSKRRVYNGQNPNLVGSSSNVNARAVLPPQQRQASGHSYQQATNVNHEILSPAANTYRRRVVRQNAVDSSVVVASADHHHDDHHHDAADHHHDDHHGAAAGHDHAHAHGDHHGAHGDHHHHHLHNITLEQLCRDPFHAFLCLSVDTSKRRIYDGNPAQGTPSEKDTLEAISRLQLLGASSTRQLRKIEAPDSNNSPNGIPNSQSNTFAQQKSSGFRFKSTEPPRPIVQSFIATTTEGQHIPTATYTPETQSTSERVTTPSATLAFLQNVREQVYNAVPSKGVKTDESVESQETSKEQLEAEVPVRKQVERRPQFVDETPEVYQAQPRRQSNRRPVQRDPVPTSETYLRRRPVPRDPISIPDAPEQRRPQLKDSTPTDPIPQQPTNRRRRPIRRKSRPSAETAEEGQKENFYFSAVETENANRRSDASESQETQPQSHRFGEKAPRRKRLPLKNQNFREEIDGPINPASFVRGPRGVASDLAAFNLEPEVKCKEPFHAYQCKHSAEGIREKRDTRSGNMRGSAQGQEPEQGEVTEAPPKIVRKRTKIPQPATTTQATVADIPADDAEDVIAKAKAAQDAYQKGIELELKLREIEANNRKEEQKRRDEELENRKEELKRREKDQEARKEEAKRRKDEIVRRKAEDERRKLEKKVLEDENASEDEEEQKEIEVEDDEEKTEDQSKEALVANYEKGLKDDLKRREVEVKRREEEAERREKELIRREIEEKRRLMEAERRRVQDKRIEEELERQRLEKIRVAEELVRREEEDDRRKEAKLKAEEGK